MKILAFAASNSSGSINRQLVMHAADVLRERINRDAQVHILDLNDFEMPLYSTDRENEQGVPAHAQRFLDLVAEADALLISFAEHNGTYTVAYKNLFDWASRLLPKVYQGKPAVLLSTSPGRNGAASVMKVAMESAPFFGMEVLASVSVARFHEVFADGALVDDAVSTELEQALATLL